MERLSLLFKGDDHVLWYLTQEQKIKMKLYAGFGQDAKPLPSRLLLLQGWADIALRMQTELEVFLVQGKGAGLLTQNLREVNRERYDYSEFLKSLQSGQR